MVLIGAKTAGQFDGLLFEGEGGLVLPKGQAPRPDQKGGRRLSMRMRNVAWVRSKGEMYFSPSFMPSALRNSIESTRIKGQRSHLSGVRGAFLDIPVQAPIEAGI